MGLGSGSGAGISMSMRDKLKESLGSLKRPRGTGGVCGTDGCTLAVRHSGICLVPNLTPRRDSPGVVSISKRARHRIVSSSTSRVARSI